MVLANSPEAIGSSLQINIIYEASREDFATRPHLFMDETRAVLRTYTLFDHRFELPHKHLEASKTIRTASRPAGPHSSTSETIRSWKYDFPGEYAQRFDGVSGAAGINPTKSRRS